MGTAWLRVVSMMVKIGEVMILENSKQGVFMRTITGSPPLSLNYSPLGFYEVTGDIDSPWLFQVLIHELTTGQASRNGI